MNNTPLIEEPEHFPKAIMNFLPNGAGAMLVVQLGPITSFNHFFDARSLDGITKEWNERKQQMAMALRAVQKSRND